MRSTCVRPSWLTLQFLFLINIALQVVDGLATYYGLAEGVDEGNPVVRICIEYIGVGWALVSVKGVACALVLSLRTVANSALVVWGLIVTAVSYVLLSLVPWASFFL